MALAQLQSFKVQMETKRDLIIGMLAAVDAELLVTPGVIALTDSKARLESHLAIENQGIADVDAEIASLTAAQAALQANTQARVNELNASNLPQPVKDTLVKMYQLQADIVS